MKIKKFRLAVILLLFFLVLIPAGAQSFFDYINPALNIGMMYFAANNGKQGVDSDPLTPVIGFSVGVNAVKYFRLELTGDVYQKLYEYNSTQENPDLYYPMTASLENRSASVIGIKPGISFTGYLPFGEKGFGARFFAGPAADFRIVTLASDHSDDFTGDINTDVQMQRDKISEYFWSKGRWFLPFAGVGFDFPVHEKLMLALDLRTWFPMYRIWTDHDIPKIDGWRFGVGIRLSPRKDRDYYLFNRSSRESKIIYDDDYNSERQNTIIYDDDYNSEQPAE